MWSSDRQLRHREASLQVTELEIILRPQRIFLGFHPDGPFRKASHQVTYLLGTGVTEGLSFWSHVSSFRPCGVHTCDLPLKPRPCVAKGEMENKVATQLFGLFPKDHDSWRLKSASRDRTCGGAEEGGEENETNPADTVEKAA